MDNAKGHGYISCVKAIPRTPAHFGISLREDLPTRWEEFTFAKQMLERLPAGRLLDAACGFEPGVHIFPQIASGLGWQVEAVDLTPPWPGFPEDPQITRVTADITALPYFDATFDAAVCISALEHMSAEIQEAAFREMHRVLKPGRMLLATLDRVGPGAYARFLSDLFDFGEEISFEGHHLQPCVAYLIGTKI